MPGKAKSISVKARERRTERDGLMDKAVALYRLNDTLPSLERKSLRTVCTEISTAYHRETGKWVELDKTTLSRLASNPSHRTISAFNATKSWLTEEETEYIISYAIELADRGFPLNHARLKELVDSLLRKRLGAPFEGVGKSW
ncbi:hypothetical protein FKP32DRAFT_1554964, partial [Trametes sanguinea]